MVEGYAGELQVPRDSFPSTFVRAQCHRAAAEGSAGQLPSPPMPLKVNIVSIPDQTRSAKEQFLRQGPGSLAMDKEEVDVTVDATKG